MTLALAALLVWAEPVSVVPLAEPLAVPEALAGGRKLVRAIDDHQRCGGEVGAHTTSLGAGGARASLGGRAARGSGARAGGVSGRGAVNGEVVGAEAGLLAVGVLLGIGSSAGTLRAGGDTAVGVVDLGLVGAGNLVALGGTADVLSGT